LCSISILVVYGIYSIRPALSQYINKLFMFYTINKLHKRMQSFGLLVTMSGILNRGLVDSMWLSTWKLTYCGTKCTQCDAKACASPQITTKTSGISLLSVMWHKYVLEVHGSTKQAIFLTYCWHFGVPFHSSKHSHPFLIHRMAYI